MSVKVLDCDGREVGKILDGPVRSPFKKEAHTHICDIFFMKEIFTMPDENKFAMLGEVCYTVRASCGICAHGTFIGLAQWGTCAKHTYEHKKHSGEKRQMSINVLGVCKTFEADEAKLDKLQSFKNFFVGE